MAEIPDLEMCHMVLTEEERAVGVAVENALG
jgi:hypothetical protein